MAAPDRLSTDAGEPLAVYERRVAASEERVWENVLDWEHLPWLHGSSFRTIHCEAAGRWGWRARVGLPPRSDPREMTVELRVDWEDRSYHTRTLAGPGAGSDVFTRVRPAGPDATDVRVELRVPGAAPERAAALGRGWIALYTRLWDEDEAMMRRREAFLAGRLTLPRRGAEPLRLGPVDALRASLPRTVESGGARFRIVAWEDRLLAHATVCPHLGGPLEDARIEGGAVVCPWHGYRFDCATGKGPAGQRCRLAVPARVAVEDGEAVLHFG